MLEKYPNGSKERFSEAKKLPHCIQLDKKEIKCSKTVQLVIIQVRFGLYFLINLYDYILMEAQDKIKVPRIRRFLRNFGKFVIDITKLCFGSLVLGSVIKGEIPPYMLLTGGIIASAVGAVIGLTIVSLCEEK